MKTINVEQCNQYYEFIDKLLGKSSRTNFITKVIILGDVMHEHGHVQTTVMNRVIDFLKMIKDYGCQIYILVGNHDMVSTKCANIPTNHWMYFLKVFPDNNIIIIDQPQIIDLDGKACAMIPFLPPNEFKKTLEEYKIDLNKVDYCFAHQEFKGCKMGAIISEHADEYTWETLCISGHIHNKSIIPFVYYTGSSFQHSFDQAPCFVHVLDIKKAVTHTMQDQYNLEEILVDILKKNVIHKKLNESKLCLEINASVSLNPQYNKIIVQVTDLNFAKAWKSTENYKEISKYYTITFKVDSHSETKQYTKPQLIENFMQRVEQHDGQVKTKVREILQKI